VNIRVVNDSATFSGTAYSQALSDEIDALGANNILFVTAAGNTGQDNDTTARYPCSYRRANEICVTARDHNDKIPSWANYGSSSVDLAAPGVSIYSTLRNGNYGWLSGGSMASPQVAGAAALLLSNQPSLSVSAVKSAILNNVDPIAGMSGLVRTGGRLDVCKAIPGCQQPALVKTAAPAPGTDGTSATLNGSVSPQNTSTSFYFRYSLNPDMSGATTTGSQSAGSGGTSQPVSQTVTGLEPNTTYYVQVLATNATGTTSGSVLSFRTSSVGPQVSTAPASSLTGSSAVLNGSVNPENSSTTYSSTYSPNAGMTGASTTGSQSAGSGSTSQPVSQTVTGLEPNTTYYVQVLATNGTGTTNGSVLSFRTSSIGPQVSTAPASSLTGSSAVLNGSVNPENSSTTYSFTYSPNADMSGASATGTQSAGSGGTSQPVSQTVTGLEPNTTYYVQVLATNGTGTSTGPVVSFATSAPPLAITGAVQSIGPATAVFTASVNPQNSPTTYVFDYSPNPDMSGATQAPPDNPLDVRSGNSFAEVSQQVSGLAPDTTYYVQVVATNEASPARTAVGSVQSFTTAAQTTTTTTTTTPVPAPPPGAVTLPASSLGNSSAVLNGAVNPDHSPTTYTFRCSPHADMSGATQAHAASAAGSDSTAHPESQTLTGLAPKTTYYFQIVATSPAGTTSGSVRSFTTMALSFNGPRPRGPSLSRRVPSGQTLSSLLRHGLTVRVRCGGRCALKAELLLPVLVSLAGGRHHTTMTVLGGVSRTLLPGHTLQFTITLSRTGRRVLAHSSGATLTLQLSASAGAGKPTTSRLRVTLKRR
jgi:phosphodiesterase/alkaline phosphatase D-like protein